jgi:hypothetical protein
MTERPAHAPVFARPGEPEPNAHSDGVLVDGGRTWPEPEPPVVGLGRVAQLGGADALADGNLPRDRRDLR